MINNQLLGYVKQQLSLGIGRETITTNLKSQGWTDADLSEAFSAIGLNAAPALTPVSPMAVGVTQNVAQMQPAQTNFSNTNPVVTPHKSKKIIPIIVVLVLLVLAGGVAGYAYYSGIFVKLPDLLLESMERAKATTSVKYDMSFNINSSEIQALNSAPNPSGIDFKNFNFSLNGVSDISDLKNPKLSSVLSFSMGSILASAELRVLDSTFYGQITKVPTFGLLPIPTLYENKWFSLSFKPEDIEKLKNLASSYPIDLNNITNQFTSEQQDHLLKLFQDANLLKTAKRLNPETVGGEPSYHFSFDFDRGGVISLAQSVYDYLNTISVNKNIPKLPPFNSVVVSELLDKIKNFNGEIWIGRNDKLVHKLSISFGVQFDSAKNEQVKVNTVIVYSDYNKSVSVVAPEGSTSLNDLILASLGVARQKGKEASIKANISNLHVQAELFWDAHNGAYSGFCASKELKDTRAAIETAGGTGFVCKETAQKYAVGVKLSKDFGYWCIDSTGANKSTATLSSGTVCLVK